MRNYTQQELRAIWRSILRSVGGYGWDWHTLAHCYPQRYAVLTEIRPLLTWEWER